jgi:hypothetical protein
MGLPSFTLLRLGKTLLVVIAQCTPIFIRIVLGQTMDANRWGLLRVDSVPRGGFQARIYLAQFITSSIAAAVFAINLIRAVDQNASYRASLEKVQGQTGVPTTGELYNWWHVEFILLSALAAVVADTVYIENLKREIKKTCVYICMEILDVINVLLSSIFAS